MSYISDAVNALGSCMTCFSAPTIRVNGRRFRILKLLGEGGFSYVYLVQDTSTQRLLALKKVRCAFGKESVDSAKREIASYKLFRSEYVIRLLDSDIVQEADGNKTVYMVLPYYEQGNLQDKINDNILCGTSLDEAEIRGLTIEICRAIKVLHHHVAGQYSQAEARYSMEDVSRADASLLGGGLDVGGGLDADNFDIGSEDEYNDYSDNHSDNHNDNHNEGQRLLANRRSMTSQDGATQGATHGATHETTQDEASQDELNREVPYAHRDIKPGNIMFGAQGRPVLMDFGSCAPARMTVSTRQQALELQDLAAEHCTMPYRAPELFDVKTGVRVDERVDVWSLGCTIFALMYGVSPFEQQQNETGASLNMAIMSGQYKFPATPAYSDGLKELVSRCLTVDGAARPFIDEVQDLAEAL